METSIPITPTGAEKLKSELKHLKTVERPQIIQEIQTARALGDLSENAEYHSARERQGFIEGRIQELENKISRLQVIPVGSGEAENVVFGTTVTIKDTSSERGEARKYRIVGDMEADLKQCAISISSPLAQELINKRKGDFVNVRDKEYEIVRIHFEH